MNIRCLPLILGFIAFAAPAMGLAQESSKAFSTPAFAIDATTLNGNNATITLWGVEAAAPKGTPDAVRARAALDDLIGDRPVKCITTDGPATSGNIRARCLNAAERDIGLTLVTSGLVAANRRDLVGTELSGPYIDAERRARNANIGFWGNGRNIQPQQNTAPAVAPSGDFLSQITGSAPLWVIAGALVIVPVIGFLIIGVIMHLGFRQLITLQRYQIAGTQKRERQLKEREKYVIASALENEINTNRAKLDAFLVIYEELLKSLRDPGKTPKYQRGGDIIHDKPGLTRTVYDSHVDKMEILGPQLSGDLSSLYQMIVSNPDYRTLEPEVPVEKAREIVDRIVRNAERLIEPMDKVAGALSVIVRDKRGAIAMAE